MGTQQKAVRLSDLKPGDRIEIDDGFTCADAGTVDVCADTNGELYFACEDGRHYLEGQLDFDGSDVLVGIVGHTPKAGV